MSSEKIPGEENDSNDPILEAVFVADFENGLTEAVKPRRGGWRMNELDVRPHGTVAAARRHYRHGETPCESCRQAEHRAWQDYSARRKPRGRDVQ
jgi:hypothetical protein